jgi:hypothetical protein
LKLAELIDSAHRKEGGALKEKIYASAFSAASGDRATQARVARDLVGKVGTELAIFCYEVLREQEPNNPGWHEGYADAYIARTREMLQRYSDAAKAEQYTDTPSTYADHLRQDIPHAKTAYDAAEKLYQAMPEKTGGYRENANADSRTPFIERIGRKIEALNELEQEISAMQHAPAIWEMHFTQIDTRLDAIRDKMQSGQPPAFAAQNLDELLADCIEAKREFTSRADKDQEVESVIQHMEQRIERTIELKEQLNARA